MPELPEVETVVRGLRPELVGRVIAAVEVRYPGALVRPEGGKSRLGQGDGAGFVGKVQGRRVEAVRRRAKLIIVDLDNRDGQGLHLLVHLKMTGRLWLPPDGLADQHTRIIFTLDDGRQLHFHDARRFGYCLALDDAQLLEFLAPYGPEPLDMLAGELVDALGARCRNIKALLLDQSVVVGVGNIYADEALHRAGISPKARGCDVPRAKLKKLHGALQAVLTQAIAENGSSFRNYVNHKGDAGAFQNQFRVYGRGGQACVTCGQTLRSEVVAARSTVWCERCQPAE